MLRRAELHHVLGVIGLADPEEMQQRLAGTAESLAEPAGRLGVASGIVGDIEMTRIGDRLHPRGKGAAAMKQPAMTVRILHVGGAW